MALGVLIACIDETLQLFSFGRSSQMTDVVIDTCGVILGGGSGFCFEEMDGEAVGGYGRGLVHMSCLPFRRVEFPGDTLACAYGALLLLHGAARFCEVQHLPLYRFGDPSCA